MREFSTAVPQIDFLISNDRHHAATARLVATELVGRGSICRVVSLCELRGLETPETELTDAGLDVHRLLPGRFRRPPSQGGRASVRPATRFRRALRAITWWTLLRPRIRHWLKERPDLVVLPNDAAFPYDRICGELRARPTPFLVLQEGIRFIETASQVSGITAQGRSGAAAIACWGETSKGFFLERGAPPRSLHATGNPRFDAITSTDWNLAARALADRLPPGRTTLSFFSNPIELWGFCTGTEKLALVEHFVQGLEPLFKNDGLRLVVKIHSSENVRDFEEVTRRSGHGDSIAVLSDAPLYPLLHLSDAAVIFASTVGLEALLLGVALGVLEIPGTGFLHDFVSSDAALGVDWAQDIAPQVRLLLHSDGANRASVHDYIDRTLAHRGSATTRVADLIQDLTRSDRAVG